MNENSGQFSIIGHFEYSIKIRVTKISVKYLRGGSRRYAAAFDEIFSLRLVLVLLVPSAASTEFDVRTGFVMSSLLCFKSPFAGFMKALRSSSLGYLIPAPLLGSSDLRI